MPRGAQNYYYDLNRVRVLVTPMAIWFDATVLLLLCALIPFGSRAVIAGGAAGL